LKFYVVSHPKELAMTDRQEFPYVELLSDNWNDYGFETYFTAYYYNITLEDPINLGAVKILHKNSYYTRNVIPETFTRLELNKYCSLGQSMEYYEKIRGLGVEIAQDILHGLRDIAIHKRYYYEFTNKQGIEDSFFRSSEASKAFKSAVQFFGGEKRLEEFVFSYKYNPPYSSQRINLNFDFTKKDFLPNRISVLIGKNGCGKTQFMARFANSLCGKETKENSIEAFDNMPLFSKVIAVSFSAFDDFSKPKQTKKEAFFGEEPQNNYVYCGIQGNDGRTLSLVEMQSIAKQKFRELRRKEDRYLAWEKILKNVLEDEFESLVGEPEQIFQSKLSSGQGILLYTMTNVIANIKEESIVLFDEPELHLHPNAISNLMRMLYDLLNEYNSYAIVSTHSPLIIQETPTRYIKKFIRKKNILDVTDLTLEAFGENLTTITEDVFNVRDVESNYKTFLRNAMVEDGLQLNEILNIFPVGLSYNAMTYLGIVEKNNKRLDD